MKQLTRGQGRNVNPDSRSRLLGQNGVSGERLKTGQLTREMAGRQLKIRHREIYENRYTQRAKERPASRSVYGQRNALHDPVQQYLTQSGRTLFKGMRF
jgi:hypothetical protein